MSYDEKVKSFIKVSVTVILLIYLFFSINLGTIYDTLARMDLLPLFVSIPLVCLMYLIRAEKWRALLMPVGINMPFASAFKIFLIGTFYGSVTPGRMGEVSRSFFMGEKKSKTVPSIIIDRITDIICLLTLSIVSILVFFRSVELIIITVGMSLLFIICIIMLLERRVVTLLFKLLKVSDDNKYGYMDAIGAIIKNKRALLYAAILTLGYYAINMVAFWLVLRALSVDINPIIVLSLPLIIILGNVPISISGLGVRELVSVSIFSMYGQSAAYGFSASFVLYLLTSLLPGLVGLVFTLEGVRPYGSEKREL